MTGLFQMQRKNIGVALRISGEESTWGFAQLAAPGGIRMPDLRAGIRFPIA